MGFAVFSVFALAPDQESAKGQATDTQVQVSSAPVETGFLAIGSAFADEIAPGQTRATVLVQYEGPPPTTTSVSVSNLTGGQRLGTYRVQDSLTLVGRPGDRLKLAFEAPGYERSAIELTLEPAAETYTVQLEESGTPLFIQRLTPAARVAATRSLAAEDDFIDAAGPLDLGP